MKYSKIMVKMMILCFAISVLRTPLQAYAANASAKFGSEGYSYEMGENFPIGVYLESEEMVGSYEIHLTYDTNVLEYVSGATGAQDGDIVLVGDLQGNSLKSMLYFRPLVPGTTAISFAAVIAKTQDQSEDMVVENLPVAPITLVEAPQEEEESVPETEEETTVEETVEAVETVAETVEEETDTETEPEEEKVDPEELAKIQEADRIATQASIQESRQSDMTKAVIILATLVVIMAVICIMNLRRSTQIRKQVKNADDMHDVVEDEEIEFESIDGMK